VIDAQVAGTSDRATLRAISRPDAILSLATCTFAIAVKPLMDIASTSPAGKYRIGARDAQAPNDMN